jgi:hypothetical protein
MTEREVMCSCIDERDEALDTIDDMIDVIGRQIIRIAYDNNDFVCSRCLSTAYALFVLMKKYAREEDTERIRAEWKHITGRDIE